MLRSASKFNGYVIRATDGDIGRAKDLLFNEEDWTVRYLVADTGRWIPKRQVLISPISLCEPEWATRRFPVVLSKMEIEDAPSISEDEPVSRRHESAFFRFYGYEPYWIGPSVWGSGTFPNELRDAQAERAVEAGNVATATETEGSPHLRSMDEVTGYDVLATDDQVGKIDDFIVDDETWIIRYVVVDTRRRLPGRKVIVAPSWFEEFDWAHQTARVDLTREQIESSPEYDPTQPVNREYEERLFDYLGRPTYWG
jgi:hypothetical protein